MRRKPLFLRPAKPANKLEEDDCPDCKGAGGRYIQTGCMGGHDTEVCDTCHGKGKLSDGRRRYLAARKSLEEASKKEREFTGRVCLAAHTWFKAKGKKKDQALIDLEELLMEQEKFHEDSKHVIEEYKKSEKDLSFEDRFGPL